MRRTTWVLKQLSAQVQAQELMDGQEHEKARDLLLELLVELERAGVAGGHVHWMLCITFDHLGDLPMALYHVEKAVAVDPLSVPFHRSFDIITSRLLSVLTDGDRAVDDPSTPKLYELLVRSGEADSAAHLVMARYCASSGDTARALRLLESLVSLDPLHHGAWELLAEVAGAEGMTELAERAGVEAAATLDQGPGSMASAGGARS